MGIKSFCRGIKACVLFAFTVFLISSCASSPHEMRSKPAYYEAYVEKSLVDVISCVSNGIDKIAVGVSEPIAQSVVYLPGSKDGAIYLSSGGMSNIAIIDFYGGVPTHVQLRYNSNVMVISDSLKKVILECE